MRGGGREVDVVVLGVRMLTYVGVGEEMREGDFHGEMEAKAKMNW